MNSLELLSFRRLIDRVVDLAKRHWRTLLLPTAAPLIGFGVLLSLVQMRWMALAQDSIDAIDVPEELFLWMGLFFLLLFVVMGVFFLTYNALLVCSIDALAGRPVSLSRGFKKVLKPSVLLILIAVAVASTASFLLCFFPALWVVPRLTFVVPAIVDEGKSGRQAWFRSIELVRHNPTGRWRDSAHLRTLAFLVVGLLINYAATFAVQWPFIVAQQVLMFREAAAGQADAAKELMAQAAQVAWLQVPSQVLGGLVTAAVWLYWTFGIALLFHELRRRKEGEDLARAIDELTGATEPV